MDPIQGHADAAVGPAGGRPAADIDGDAVQRSEMELQHAHASESPLGAPEDNHAIDCPPSPQLTPSTRLDSSAISSLSHSRRVSLGPLEVLAEGSKSGALHGEDQDYGRAQSSVDAAAPEVVSTTAGEVPQAQHAQDGGNERQLLSSASASGSADRSPPATDISGMRPDNQALMHLLSLVGSRFLEAEGSGMLTAGDAEGSDADSSDDDADFALEMDARMIASTSALEQPKSSPGRLLQSQQFGKARNHQGDGQSNARGSRVGSNLYRHLYGSKLDDQEATPRGGSTPLGASVVHPSVSTGPGDDHGAPASPADPSHDERRGASPRHRAASGPQESVSDTSVPASSASSSSGANNLHMSIHALSTHASREQSRDDEDDDGDDNEYEAPFTSDLTSADLASSAGELAHASSQDSLIDRLRDIFNLDETEEIVSCHPCWLFRGVLLQGYLYLLSSHVCFYAYLPSRQEHILRAGALKKRTRRTHRFSKHWAVLRGRSLSWYESEASPFFPQDHIDLRNVLQVCESEAGDHYFDVRTPYRTFTFDAATPTSRDGWLATLRRAVFRAQNEGESVRICAPFEAIVDVESDPSGLAGLAGKSSASSNTVLDTFSIKVLHTLPADSDCMLDEYCFVNVEGSASLREELQARLHPSLLDVQSSQRNASVRDSTQGRMSRQAVAIPKRQRSNASLQSRSSDLEGELADASSTALDSAQLLSTSAQTLRKSDMDASFIGYPPTPSTAATARARRASLLAERSNPITSLLQNTSKIASAHTSALAERLPRRLVHERWSAREPATSRRRSKSHGSTSDAMSGSDDMSNFSELDDAHESDPAEREAAADFHAVFSLPDSEPLLGHVKANLYRVLPVAGRLYVTGNYVCFRSSHLQTRAMGRTVMILPRSEIVSAAKNSAFQYGSHGVVVIVRGHEELFLEFASTQRRDQLLALLEHKLGKEADRAATVDVPAPNLLLTDLAELSLHERKRDTRSRSASRADLLSPTLSSSSSSALSAFLPTKPRNNLHFTFLTVGSRGDVQPYIALAQGLKREGHRVRIATHPEFEDWIKGFGIEFAGVGGDPAELMRICVENGTFTVAFVRESVTRFRGWLDDLLLSCWHACQGTDVIIESPSAIAGIHIAEALQVPYYRAFTMPWSRTRAYPHAFAVPTRRAGGNYNYMSYVIFDQVFWRASAGQINAWRRDTLRIKATSLDRLEPHKVPFLYNFSPSLVPKPLDWYDWIHVTGYWFLEKDQAASWTAPQDLVDFIASARSRGKKLVYIGWGSIVVSDADALLRIVLEAVRKSGVCAILSRGWSDRLADKRQTPGADPDTDQDDGSIFMVDAVPHGWLFPQLDVACHHGGSGTLGASLRAGIPTIVRPYFGDQFFWASQIEGLHVGKRLPQPFTADDFADALRSCTSDGRMRENARALGERIAAENGVQAAIRAIYTDWDYACSLIRSDSALPGKGTVAGGAADMAARRETHVTPSVDEEALEGSQPVGHIEASEDDDAKSMDGWSVVSGSEGDDFT